MKRVYLTFDDGIEPGTEEVLLALKKYQVKATFFLTGVNTLYSFNYLKDYTKSCFDKFVEAQHLICNHSFSHCFEYYSSYYTKGLLIDEITRIPPVSDFVYNYYFLKYIEEQLQHNFMSLVYCKNFIRLPGRNTFNISRQDGINPEFINDLVCHGYEMYGWHDEWQMSFEFADIRRSIRGKIDKLTRSLDLLYPYIDIKSGNYVSLDRLSEPWTVILERILNSVRRDNILLLHDRAFRPQGLINPKSQLEQLIEQLLKAGCTFETLLDYNSNS